jgi:ribonuclease BN (tRNA processing enzyme)
MQVQFVGSGDAFGSGGRFNTCIRVAGDRTHFLIDCGASSLIGMQRAGVDPDSIDAVFLTHFHADHFGGIPFLMLHAQFVTRRTRPLTLVGPPGLRGRYRQAMEVAFPSSSETEPRFALALREIAPGETQDVGAVRATAVHVRHDDRAGPCLGYRFELEGKVIAFSGDTEWTDALIDVGRDADLFICECYVRDKPVPMHMSLTTLEAHLPAIRPKRLVLTHMGQEMLAAPGIPFERAEDGKILTL